MDINFLPNTSNEILNSRNWILDLISFSSEIPSRSLKNWYKSSSDLSFIIKLFLDCGVIGGSFGLKCYNLLDRPIHDIDIICDKDDQRIQKLIKIYSEKTYGSSKTEIEKISCVSTKESVDSHYDKIVNINRIAKLKIFGMDVDLFHNTDVKFTLINGIKIHDPLEIINWKIDIYKKSARNKDLIDLNYIFSQLRTIEFFSNET